MGLFDKQMVAEEKKIKQFYKDVEMTLVELVRSTMAQNLDS